MPQSTRRRRLRGYNKDIAHGWGPPVYLDGYEEPTQEERAARYNRLKDLYTGTAFENIDRWDALKGDFVLYRHTRQLWDVVHSVVEFYATHVWDGSIARDGKNLPNGIRNAVPFAPDTDDALAAAAGQIFTWWNFQELKEVIARETANLGEYLIEIADDVERGRVDLELVWPGHVYEVELDRSGNLTSYTIAYVTEREDDDESDLIPSPLNTEYLFVRRVDKDWIRTWDLPTGFDLDNLDDEEPDTEEENEYGFVPARWFRQQRVAGSVRGEPAFWSTETQMEELNSLFSNVLDKAHVSLNAPIVIAGNINTSRFKQALDSMREFHRRIQADSRTADDGREALNIFQGPQGTTVSTIELKISEAGLALDRIAAAIERKLPEVVFYQKLRDMTQLTGPAASRLLGDVEHKLRSVAAGHDNQLTALIQMSIAIAGWRFKRGDGGWARKTKDQQKFKPFDLESYRKGDLDLNILPRQLIPPSELELLQLIAEKKKVLPFFPDLEAGKEAGYDEEEVKRWIADYEKKLQEQQEQQVQADERARAASRASGPGGGAPPGGSGRPVGIQDRRLRQPATNARQALSRVK